MEKVLFILIGPKGSGKTYIGSRIEQLAGIKFLRVEPLWLQLAEGEDGWERVEREIDALFRQRDKVREYNRIAASLYHPWDGIIDNNSPATDEEMLKVVTSL